MQRPRFGGLSKPIAGEAYKGYREGQYWVVPSEFSKNRREHRVWLSALALAQLDRHPWEATRDDVQHWLPANSGGWCAHDLRRTFSTRNNGMGVPPYVVEKMLNHVFDGVMAVYNHATYDAERRQALEAWSACLTGLASPSATSLAGDAGSVILIGAARLIPEPLSASRTAAPIPQTLRAAPLRRCNVTNRKRRDTGDAPYFRLDRANLPERLLRSTEPRKPSEPERVWTKPGRSPGPSKPAIAKINLILARQAWTGPIPSPFDDELVSTAERYAEILTAHGCVLVVARSRHLLSSKAAPWETKIDRVNSDIQAGTHNWTHLTDLDQTTLNIWMRERFKKWPIDKAPPDRDEDKAAARAYFTPKGYKVLNLDRMIRRARKDEAKRWTVPGPNGSTVQRLAASRSKT
jgi:hypothetical protein